MIFKKLLYIITIFFTFYFIPKMGFSAPVADWLREDFGYEVERSLLTSPLVKDAPLKRQPIADLISAHRSGHSDHSLHLWTLFNLTAWHNHWIE